MPQIRPISDLRNNFTEISRIVHESYEPVYLTKNGYGDMVVMSVELFEKLGIAALLIDKETKREPALSKEPEEGNSFHIQKPLSRWQKTLSDLAKR